MIEQKKYREGGGCSYSSNPNNRTPSICPACCLLGAQGLVGFIRIPYLYTESMPEDIYAVRIDRATSVVAEKTNRDVQLIAKGKEFSGVLEVVAKDSIKGWELGKSRIVDEKNKIGANDAWLNKGAWNADRIIKELIEDRLKDISLLGGFKSRGCGKVEIQITEVRS